VECSGSGAGADSNCLYGVYVSSSGELVYRHENGTRQEVLLKTAASTIRTGRYHFVAIRRATVGSQHQVELYLDNKLVPWANGTGLVEKPSGGSASSILLGKSAQKADSAYWYGTLDELSLHDVARSYQPYIRGVYYRLTLTNLFFRLTVLNNVKSLGGAEMGGGTRWWVYERDNNLYAVRENTLGLFSPEVALTMGGLQPNGVLATGGTEKPTILYDKVNDLLVVAFIAAGRIYKLTATSSDVPQTQTMPFTVDTSTIAKARDSNEGIRAGIGTGTNRLNALSYVNRQPIKQIAADSGAVGQGVGPKYEPMTVTGFVGGATDNFNPGSNIQFTGWSSFGIYIPWNNSYGYAVYAFQAGTEVLLGYVRSATLDTLGRTAGFWPIPDRVFGTWYYVKALRSDGKPKVNWSNWICDMLGTVDYPYYMDRFALALHYNISGDDPQLMPLGLGEGTKRPNDLSYVNRQPMKFGTADSGTVGVGTGGSRFSVSCTTTLTAPQRKRVEVS
jgi:hypothetical protein